MGHFKFSSSEDLEIRVEGFWNIYHFSLSFNWAVCVKPPISSHQVSTQSIAESRWLRTTPLSVSDKPKKTERPCCILTYLLYSTMGKGKSSSKVPWKKGDMLVPRRLIGNPLNHPIWDTLSVPQVWGDCSPRRGASPVLHDQTSLRPHMEHLSARESHRSGV